jgi:hypothetical protein
MSRNRVPSSAQANPSIASGVRWCPRRRALVSQNQLLKGLTQVLKQTFYPRYTFQRHSVRTEATSHAPTHQIRGSRRVGIGLDRVVTQSVDLFLRYQLKPEVFWNAAAAERACEQIALRSHKATLRGIARRRVPYIRWFWAYMSMQRWIPVATQVAVRHPSLRLGTMADLVCMDAQGVRHVLEIKTGFENSLLAHTAHGLQRSFAGHNDCHLHQHYLQLAATHAMYCATHSQHRMGRPLLMRFDSRGVTCSALPAWASGASVASLLFQDIKSCVFARQTRV